MMNDILPAGDPWLQLVVLSSGVVTSDIVTLGTLGAGAPFAVTMQIAAHDDIEANIGVSGEPGLSGGWCFNEVNLIAQKPQN